MRACVKPVRRAFFSPAPTVELAFRVLRGLLFSSEGRLNAMYVCLEQRKLLRGKNSALRVRPERFLTLPEAWLVGRVLPIRIPWEGAPFAMPALRLKPLRVIV